MHSGKQNKDSAWRIVYTFTEAEFFEADYQAANFVVSKMPGGLFTDNLIFSQYFWLSDEEAAKLGGDGVEAKSPARRYMGRIGVKGAVFNKHMGPDTEHLATVKTELERREALKRYCGFEVSKKDLEHIQGSVAALPLDA